MQLTKRNIIGLIVVLTLLIAIPLGIYLAQKTQIFKPRATAPGGSPQPAIKVTGQGVSCIGDTCNVTSDKVDLELTSPLGPPAPSASPSPTPSASPAS